MDLKGVGKDWKDRKDRKDGVEVGECHMLCYCIYLKKCSILWAWPIPVGSKWDS
jgi:hypothetical protein